MTLAVPPAQEPELSVLVVTYGAWAMTERALTALLDNTDAPLELIVVDNASGDETRERLAQLSGASVLYNEHNKGFGPAVNQAAAVARGQNLLLLNTDAFVHPGWLEPMREALENDWVGAVVPRYLNSDGSLQEAAALLARDGTVVAYGDGDDPDDPRYSFRRVVDYGAAACMLTRRRTFEALGGLDALFAPAYYEDVDYCMRLARAGLRTVYEPGSTVTHARYGSASIEWASILSVLHRHTFAGRWHDWLVGRPETLVGASDEALLQARDAAATPRILVCATPADRAAGPTLEFLRAGWPQALITWATGVQLQPRQAGRWLGLGVELIEHHDPAWLQQRLFHYDLVCVGSGPTEPLRAALERTQPQAQSAPLLAAANASPNASATPLAAAMLAAGIPPALASA